MEAANSTVGRKMNVRVIIPSKQASNLLPCLRSLHLNQPNLDPSQITIIDDGLDWSAMTSGGDAHWMGRLNVVDGTTPFVFARNVNLGLRIARSENAHAFVLNDDAVLETRNGLGILLHHLETSDYGILSPSVDSAGNRNQNNRGEFGLIRSEPRMLCFMAVLIRRDLVVADKPGLMDERYIDYGMDDDDYCRDTTQAGWKLGVVDDVVINHTILVSTFRGQNKGGDFSANMRRFIAKHGVDNWGQSKATSKFAHLFPF